MTTPRGNMYSFERAWFSRVTASGIACGQLNPDSLTPDTTSHAYLINGTVSATLPAPTFGKAEFRGGGRYEGKADLGLESLADGEFIISQLDLDFAALITQALVDTTSLSGATIGALNNLNPSPIQGTLALISRIQDRKVSAGQNRYLHIMFPLVQLREVSGSPTQEGGVNPSPSRVIVTPIAGNKFPIGSAFGSNQAWYDDSELFYFIISNKPYFLSCFVQDGTETVYTAAYRPTSSVVTGGNTTNWSSVNGVVTARSSINTSTGAITLAAAGTSGQLAVDMYQTDFVLAA